MAPKKEKKIINLSVPNFGSKSVWTRKLICPLCRETDRQTLNCLQFCWSHSNADKVVSSVVTVFQNFGGVCCNMILMESRKRSRCCRRYTSSYSTDPFDRATLLSRRAPLYFYVWRQATSTCLQSIPGRRRCIGKNAACQKAGRFPSLCKWISWTQHDYPVEVDENLSN